MGFGCNAAGVVGCRIIDSPRERLIAILTNSFVPCNGRFPTLIAIISMFFIGSSLAEEEFSLGEISSVCCPADIGYFAGDLHDLCDIKIFVQDSPERGALVFYFGASAIPQASGW
jgi:hypothetical protein